MGAVAVAVAVLVAPSVAAAGPDDPAQVAFKLPSRDAIADFEALGLNMDHAIRDTADGGALVSAWVTDEQLAAVKARGYEPVRTITDKYLIDHIRAEREKAIANEQAAERALNVNAAGRRGASAAPGVVRAQRADYFTNNVGRYLSIEAHHLDAPATCQGGASPQCPVVVAEWYDAAGNHLGGGNVEVYYDNRLNPDYYQYHFDVVRIGDKGDGGAPPATIKVAASNGHVDTLEVREWIAENRPSRVRASCRASCSATTTRKRRTRRCATWRRSSTTSPTSSSCRRRRAATSAGPRPAAVPAVRDAELLRPGREGGARPHQVAPWHGDPAAADRPGDRRPLLGGRQ